MCARRGWSRRYAVLPGMRDGSLGAVTCAVCCDEARKSAVCDAVTAWFKAYAVGTVPTRISGGASGASGLATLDGAGGAGSGAEATTGMGGRRDGENSGRDSESDRAADWASMLCQPEIARLMPTGKARADLLVEAGEALTRPPDLEGYVRGCRYTADRVGLLCCGSPLVALRALAGQLKHDGTSSAEEGARQERVRSSAALRELIAFMLSDEYASLVED